jgi:hypothetical protein
MANAIISESVLEVLIFPEPLAEVSESVLETMVIQSPNALVSESVLEILALPAVVTAKILLRGVKRVPTCLPTNLEQAAASKPVKRAV